MRSLQQWYRSPWSTRRRLLLLLVPLGLEPAWFSSYRTLVTFVIMRMKIILMNFDDGDDDDNDIDDRSHLLLRSVTVFSSKWIGSSATRLLKPISFQSVSSATKFYVHVLCYVVSLSFKIFSTSKAKAQIPSLSLSPGRLLGTGSRWDCGALKGSSTKKFSIA